jgi:hypothetical protein
MVHLYGRFPRKISNSNPAVVIVSQLWLSQFNISACLTVVEGEYKHVDGGNSMAQLDGSNLITGCETILSGTGTAGRTLFFQNEVRVMPVDHVVDTRSVRVEKRNVRLAKISYIRLHKVTRSGFGRCRHKTRLATPISCYYHIEKSPRPITETRLGFRGCLIKTTHK